MLKFDGIQKTFINKDIDQTKEAITFSNKVASLVVQIDGVGFPEGVKWDKDSFNFEY